VACSGLLHPHACLAPPRPLPPAGPRPRPACAGALFVALSAPLPLPWWDMSSPLRLATNEVAACAYAGWKVLRSLCQAGKGLIMRPTAYKAANSKVTPALLAVVPVSRISRSSLLRITATFTLSETRKSDFSHKALKALSLQAHWTCTCTLVPSVLHDSDCPPAIISP
jgi:hypothetical protein